jgi:hypothetical protein
LLADDVAEHGKEIRYILESLPEFYQDVMNVRASCPTIDLFVEQYYKVITQ